jgi:hypothetical protein
MTDRELQYRLARLAIPQDDELAARQTCETALNALQKELRTTCGGADLPPPWTWRDWLWPSPLAWGAFAAIWVIFAGRSFVHETDVRNDTPAIAKDVDHGIPDRSPLFVYAEQQALLRAWQLQLSHSR